MILQQLNIHNIASIEDATIDFETQPLAESEVFLITGKTGAGKSTILDAICLALYANTPRLDNTNMQGNTKDQDRDIKVKDTSQLMRRNTGEAHVTLTFTGSNGVHYEATWSVARAHKKLTGNIQGKKWMLHNLDADLTYTKDKEIREEIARAIGLDFSQFCRTTLLAQGEFTRFLNSKDDEKAEILEKITGVDAYSKIGMKIFEKTSAMRKAWEEAQQNTAGITLLSDEEKTAKQTELANLAEQGKALKAATDDISKKLTWLHEEQKLHLRHTQAQEAFDKAQAIMGSEEKKKEERTVALWNETIDARHWLHDTEEQTSHIKQQEESLRISQDLYRQIRGAYLHETDATESIAQKKKQADDFLQQEKPHVSLYENEQSIHAHMRLIEEGRKKIASYQEDVKKTRLQLQDVHLPQLTNAKDRLANELQSLTSKEQDCQQAGKALEALNLPSLRHLCDDKKSIANAIATALSTLEQYKEEKQRTEQAEANLTALAEEIKQEQKKAEKAAQMAHDAGTKRDATKEIYEKQRESINEWAKSIRIQLGIGDICPVCQQKLTSALPHEDSIDALVAKTAEAAKAAEQAYEKLTKEKNVLEANILALTGRQHNDAAALEKDKKTLASTRQKLKEALHACHLDDLLSAEETLLHNVGEAFSTLTLASQRIATQIENLAGKVSEAEKQEQQVKAMQKAVEKQRKQVEKLKDAATLAERQKDECEHQISKLLSLSASKEAEVNEAFERATHLTGTTQWETAPLAYAKSITQSATLYNKYKEEKQLLEKELTQRKLHNENIAAILGSILKYMPAWSSISEEDLQHLSLDNLAERATRLQAQVASALSQMKTSQEAFARSQNLLADFMAEHHMESSLLKALDAYPQATIAKMTKELNDAKQELSQKEAIRKEAEDAYKAHLEKAEAMGFSENDMAEKAETERSLSSRQQDLDIQLRELSDKRGGIMRDLEIDQANLQRIGNLKKEEEAKKAEYNKWDRLNQLLGDATGNKFRRIAQSYVLASLIHSANSYMRTLSDRYVLKVVPGTFVITMEDAYQGYVSRAASTLSGGESFLVSLSLALALSDIGNQLAVDTLFIDEGFGTLSGEPLQHAINTLRSLHTHSGRHVGIISHVDELKERIPVQIRVNQEGNNSSSAIEIVG